MLRGACLIYSLSLLDLSRSSDCQSLAAQVLNSESKQLHAAADGSDIMGFLLLDIEACPTFRSKRAGEQLANPCKAR